MLYITHVITFTYIPHSLLSCSCLSSQDSGRQLKLLCIQDCTSFAMPTKQYPITSLLFFPSHGPFSPFSVMLPGPQTE